MLLSVQQNFVCHSSCTKLVIDDGVIWPYTSSSPSIVVLPKKSRKSFWVWQKYAKRQQIPNPFYFWSIVCVCEHGSIVISQSIFIPLARFFSLDCWSHTMCILPSSPTQQKCKSSFTSWFGKILPLPLSLLYFQKHRKSFWLSQWYAKQQQVQKYRTILILVNYLLAWRHLSEISRNPRYHIL